MALMLLGGSLETAQAESSISNSSILSSDEFVAPGDRAWIYDVGTLLYSDNDEDAYFSGISLSIDADTLFLSYRVFINIDIMPIGSNRFERLHTTRSFDLFSRSSSDEFRVDIDLVQNFDPQLYDLSISLIEDGTEQILDQVTADDFSNLRSLSLESEDNDDIFVPVIDRPVNTVVGNVRVEESAGSTGYLMLAILLMNLRFKVWGRVSAK